MTAGESVLAPTQVVMEHDTLVRLAVRRFVRHRLAITGLGILVVILMLAVFAPFLTGYSPEELDLHSIRLPPSSAHVLGTDTLGFDVWSRVLFGARTSLIVGFGAVAISILIGTTLGVLAGYYARRIDQVVGRATATLLSLPALLQVLAFAPLARPSP